MAKASVGEMLHTLFGPPPDKRRLPQSGPAPEQAKTDIPEGKRDLPVLLAAQAQKIYNPGMPPIPPGMGAPSIPGPMGGPQQKVKAPTNPMLKQGTAASMDLSDNWGNPTRIGSSGT
jgi:hypothetical protein